MVIELDIEAETQDVRPIPNERDKTRNLGSVGLRNQPQGLGGSASSLFR